MFYGHDYLDSWNKTHYKTILAYVNGESEWEIYFRNQTCSKRGGHCYAL